MPDLKTARPDDSSDIGSPEHAKAWVKRILQEELPTTTDDQIAHVVNRVSEIIGGRGLFVGFVQQEVSG
jgi:hypothetical protein